MKIRLARKEDIQTICRIYDLAREHMRAEGNTDQWKKYPNEENALEDFRKKALYVMEEDEIVAVFTFFIGEEKNYQKIERGAWGKSRGITKGCFSYCLEQISYLRIDTHEKNFSMQAALKSFGFQYCGVVHVEDGSSRLAFDYIPGE